MKKMIPVLLSSLLLFSSTSFAETTEELTPVTLNEVAHSCFYAPMYAAFENGYFEEEGLDVTLVTGFGADKTMTAVLSDEADIGFMGAEASIYTYQRGALDAPVNFAQLTQRAGNFLVAREAMEDFSWEDLKGKTILGGRKGGMPEMVFEYILRNNRLNPLTDLTINQSIDFGSTAAAFKNGQGDFTVEFEPHASLLEQEGAGYVVASLGEASGYVPYTAFCAKSSYLKAHPDVIQSFTNALQKGMNFVHSNSAAVIAATIAPQFPESDETLIGTIVERYLAQDTWPENLIFEEESLELLQTILMESDELENAVNYSDLINTEFAKSAAISNEK